jgi:hypothetical protein
VTAPDLTARLEAIVADLEAAGARVTPLGIIAHALDHGLDEDTAVALAAMIREHRKEGEQHQFGVASATRLAAGSAT